MAPNGIALAGVSLDLPPTTPERARGFLAAYGVDWVNGYDRGSRMSSLYLPELATPYYVLVDASGRMAGVSGGARGMAHLQGMMQSAFALPASGAKTSSPAGG